mgnify:FL=1
MNQNLVQGTGGCTTVTHSRQTDKARYQTRILSIANKVNLEFAEAETSLVQGLSASIAGVF